MRSNICQMLAITLLVGSTFSDQANAADGKKTKGGSVTGIVKLDGDAPKRRRIFMFEKGGRPSECNKLHKEGLFDENLLVDEKGGIKNAFVYIRKGLERGKEYPMPKKPAVLNQVSCMFSPRMQGVRVGQPFVMKNGDPLLHNIRANTFRNRPFNVAQPADSEERTKSFRTREKAVMIQCDLHPWMKAYAFIMDHPFFSVTNAKGEFKIEGLPAGEYTLSVWHEEFKEQQVKVTITKDGTTKTNVALKERSED